MVKVLVLRKDQFWNKPDLITLRFCMFDLMLYILVNSSGHGRALLHFRGLVPNVGNVMKLEICFDYDHPSK